MTQREIRHHHGEVPACLPCSAPARIISARHIVDLRGTAAGGGHFLECSLCGRRTARHPDFWAARAQWVLQPHALAPIVAAAPPASASNVRAIRSRSRE